VGELLRSVTAQTNAMLVVVTHSVALAETLPRRARMEEGQLRE
jgi:ABC-type lipoprotein export system ATPase subunit